MHPLSPPSAVAPSSDNPIAETSRTTSCTKPPHPASFSHHATASPIVRNRPPDTASRSLCAWAGVHASYGLTPLPNRCLATSSKPPASLVPPHPSLNRHMRYVHQLLHSLQPLPSSQHPQRLPSLGYPSISLLLVKLVKHFCGMFPSYLQWSCHTYLALGGDKGTKLRMRLTRNGIRRAPRLRKQLYPTFLRQ
jgi:hypothetical protein